MVMSLEEVHDKIKRKEDYRVACIKNGFLLPKSKRFTTRKFMQDARFEKAYCLKWTDQSSLCECPLRPKTEDLFKMLRTVILDKIQTGPADEAAKL
jgi:hypothetical protein